jgi:hypothetical protein
MPRVEIHSGNNFNLLRYMYASVYTRVCMRVLIFMRVLNLVCIEDLNLNPPVSVLLIFASVPDCSQNQTAVSDTLRLLFDF